MNIIKVNDYLDHTHNWYTLIHWVMKLIVHTVRHVIPPLNNEHMFLIQRCVSWYEFFIGRVHNYVFTFLFSQREWSDQSWLLDGDSSKVLLPTYVYVTKCQRYTYVRCACTSKRVSFIDHWMATSSAVMLSWQREFQVWELLCLWLPVSKVSFKLLVQSTLAQSWSASF